MTLNIELSYLHLRASDYNWLDPFIDNAIRNQLGIATQLFINPQAISQELVSDQTNDSQLQDFIAYFLPRSAVRLAARQRGEWYAHLLIASYHDAHILGNMYDAAITTNSRNSCAVFMSELMDLSRRDGVPLNEIVGRTVLHELGHCLALIHNTDLTIMSETNVLIQSPIPPTWYGNINYRYNAADIHFIATNPGIARPGGRIIEQTGAVSDAYLSARNNKGLKVDLMNFDLEPQLTFRIVDIIGICIRLTNQLKRSLRLPYPLNQTSRDIVVTLARPDGQTIRLNLQKGCCSGLNHIALKPQAKKYLSLNLFLDKDSILFDIPGTYRIECFIRTFGEEGNWYSSGLTELVILPQNEAHGQRLHSLYSGKLKSQIGDGFRSFLRPSFLKKLSAVQQQDPRMAVPLTWLAVGAYKNEIRLSNDSKRTQKAILQLKTIYEFLSIHEPFGIKRGKIQHDLQALNRMIQADRNITATAELQAYQQIKDYLINSKPNPKKKQHYEKKILAV